VKLPTEISGQQSPTQKKSAAHKPPLAWLVPDLALAAAAVSLFYCLFFFQGYQRLFRDSDAGWHIRTGEAILRSGELPRTDPYSSTRAGQPWFAWEWGTDVLAGAAHTAAGLGGVALLYGVVIAAGVWLWFRLHWAMGGNFLLACGMAPLLITTCSLHWLARPHVIGWLFLLAALGFFESASRAAEGVFRGAERPSRPAQSPSRLGEGARPRFRARDAAAVAGGTVLWANMHASFFFAPLIASIYAAGFALRPLIWDLDRRTEWAKARWFLWAAAVSAIAGLLNPYGWRLYDHVARYVTDSALLARVGEFQSFDFHVAGAGQIILALAIGIGGGFLALGQKRPQHFLLAALIFALALRSARALPLAALMLLPLANGAITEALDHVRGLSPAFQDALDRFLAYSRRLRDIDLRFMGLAIVPLPVLVCLVLLKIPAIRDSTGFPREQFPVAAYPEVAKLPPSARLFAPDKFGGYLIYRYNGSRKVFFDGRSDLYGAKFLKEYGEMVQLRPGWRARWDSFRFTHALAPNDFPLIPALEALGWTRIYRDGTATLLANDEK